MQAMVVNQVDIGSTVEEYRYRFGKNALLVACGHGNYPIVAELLKNNDQIGVQDVKNIEKNNLLKGLKDLCCLLLALRTDKISKDELVQVLQAFKPTHRKTNRYGEYQPIQRICDGNTALNFAQLSPEVAEKVRSILEIKN